MFTRDIETEFGIEKCSVHKNKKGKRETNEGIELLNQEHLKKNFFKYLNGER